MTLEPLRVDAELLKAAGDRLLTAAQGLPDAPEPFTVPAGSDALSQALSTEIPKAETPIIEGLPPMKQNAISTAESVIEAARRYASTDSQLKSRIDEAVRVPGSGSGDGSAGGAPASGAAVTGAPVGAALALPASAAGGQLGSMMGMPMQMAQQAAQIPSQAAGMAGALPQSAMQGVQQVGEQVTQMVSQFGGKDGQETESEPVERGGRHRAEESEESEGAASGEMVAERAPTVPARAAQTDSGFNL